MDKQLLKYRNATTFDIRDIIGCRAGDPVMGPADPRMGLYLEGKHHPQHALEPRVIMICLNEKTVVGYIGGHLTRRYDCDGELQYLYVNPEYRRNGIASELLVRLSRWFAEQSAERICVDVEPENVTARAFYARHGAVDLSEYWLVWENITAQI